MNQNNIKPQELLTGKAKKAFLSYVYGQGLEDLLIRDISLHALIIDWLDSLNICIGFTPDVDGEHSDFTAVINTSLVGFYPTRHKATQQAIKKAVEIYNKGAN